MSLPFPIPPRTPSRLSLAVCCAAALVVLTTSSVALRSIGHAAAAAQVATAAATATTTPRPATRPVLSPEQYRSQAAELRARYARPAGEWPRPTLDEGVEHRELSRLPKVTFPEDNPYSEAKAELGKQLFFDPRISGSGQIACASCHDPDLAWADGRQVSFGHDRQAVKRNAPTVMNAAFHTSFFWDGRAASLEEQALGPIAAPDEMHGGGAEDVVRRLSAIEGYRRRFAAVFGGDGPAITMENVAKAIATFERTLVGGRSRFDRFLAGDVDALSDEAVRGLHLFRTDARCLNCHNGPTLSDGKFHDVGLSYYGRKYEDLGRYRVTGRKEDVGAFRTPSLRNVARTAPYMHNGLFELDGVLGMYNAGMGTLRRTAAQADDPLFPTKSHLLKPLGLNAQDLADLRAFLESLTEPVRRVRPPELPGANVNPQGAPRP